MPTEDLAWMLSFYARVFFTYMPLLGLKGFLGLFFIVRFLESNWFVWVTQMNHIPMHIDHDRNVDWVSTQAASAAQTERSATGMRGPTRSTSRRPRSLRCRSRVHAHSQLCPGTRAALQPVNRSPAGLSRWPPRFAAPPHPSPSPALGGSRAREAAPGHVPGPAPLPAQPCPSNCVGTVIPLSEGRTGPSSLSQSWPWPFPLTLCLSLLDHPCLRTYNGSRGSQL
ncbi:hypothetical protein NN561_004294 [Cricetulus griseus]